MQILPKFTQKKHKNRFLQERRTIFFSDNEKMNFNLFVLPDLTKNRDREQAHNKPKQS